MVLIRVCDSVAHFFLCPCLRTVSVYTVMVFEEAVRDVVSVSSGLAAIRCSSDSATCGRVTTWSVTQLDTRSQHLTGKQHATPLASNSEFGPR
jgi:hypothetical protein